MIARETFDTWIGVFADRIGKPLEPHTVAAYYVALCAEMDTPVFEQAALRVFKKHAWNTWPAVIEFMSAAAEVRRIPDAEIRTTMRAIEDSRRLIPAQTTHHRQVVDDFGREWRAALTAAKADPATLKAERRSMGAAPGDDPWLTDEKRATQADARATEAA